MASAAALAYIAGFFDGEGSICLFRRNKCGVVVFRVQVVNTNRESIKFIRKTTGLGTIYDHVLSEAKRLKCKRAYVITFSKPEIKILMKMLMPYLRIKLPQAKLILKYFKLMDSTSNWDTGRKAQADKMAVKFAKLNKRGL